MKFQLEKDDHEKIETIEKALNNHEEIPLFVQNKDQTCIIQIKVVDVPRANIFISSLLDPSNKGKNILRGICGIEIENFFGKSLNLKEV